MLNILHVIASPREHNSYSFRLGQEIIKKVSNGSDNYKLIERRIAPPFLSADQIISVYKNPDTRNVIEQKSLEYSDWAINEMQYSDVIIISTPMYNMSIPASLKAWIDQIIRINVTFSYDVDKNKIGMVKNKKMYVAIASGRVHSNQQYKTDFIADYLKVVFKGIGITDITFFRVEGTAIKNINDIKFAELITDL